METKEPLKGRQPKVLVCRSQYLRLYESIECVVDLPDLAQCRFVPLPFDCSDTSICERIPTDSSVEQTGFIDNQHIVVLESAEGSFLDQQQLVVWKSLPRTSVAPEFSSINWLYFFLVNRPRRAIIKWRDRCWLIDKTQQTIPVIVRLLRWERLSLHRKMRLFFGSNCGKAKDRYKWEALQYALGRKNLNAGNYNSNCSLLISCGISTREIHLTSSEIVRLNPLRKLHFMAVQDNGSKSTSCDMLECLRDFHNHVGAPVSEIPTLLDCDKGSISTLASGIRQLIANHSNATPDQLTLRTCLALEELAEWLEAHVARDIISAADAWADRAYVLFGDAVASGLPASQLFQEVHRSNMSKSAVGRTGKGVKGPNYRPPNIGSLLNQ